MKLIFSIMSVLLCIASNMLKPAEQQPAPRIVKVNIGLAGKEPNLIDIDVALVTKIPSPYSSLLGMTIAAIGADSDLVIQALRTHKPVEKLVAEQQAPIFRAGRESIDLRVVGQEKAAAVSAVKKLTPVELLEYILHTWMRKHNARLLALAYRKQRLSDEAMQTRVAGLRVAHRTHNVFGGNYIEHYSKYTPSVYHPARTSGPARDRIHMPEYYSMAYWSDLVALYASDGQVLKTFLNEDSSSSRPHITLYTNGAVVIDRCYYPGVEDLLSGVKNLDELVKIVQRAQSSGCTLL